MLLLHLKVYTVVVLCTEEFTFVFLNVRRGVVEHGGLGGFEGLGFGVGWLRNPVRLMWLNSDRKDMDVVSVPGDPRAGLLRNVHGSPADRPGGAVSASRSLLHIMLSAAPAARSPCGCVCR